MLTLERSQSHLARSPSALQRLAVISPHRRAEQRAARVIGLASAKTAHESHSVQDTAEVFVPADTQPFAAETSIDPLVLKWMPVAVPGAAVLLCACILAIWTVV
jgi:hypothetical protein